MVAQAHAIHYLPVGEEQEQVTSETCICSPDRAADDSFTHRRSYEFGWTYPCCGSPGEGRAYGGPDGPADEVLGAYVDALPHTCA